MSDAKKNKFLTAARSVFLRYGFKRVNMNDIAEAAGVSRPALYVLFKNKEEIFVGVYLQWVDETIAEITKDIAKIETPEKRIERAFEIWSVRPFQLMITSPEARQLLECSYSFAKPAFEEGYAKFSSIIVPDLELLSHAHSSKRPIAPGRIAHILASAVRGFKLTATTPNQLRHFIKDLLLLSFPPDDER